MDTGLDFQPAAEQDSFERAPFNTWATRSGQVWTEFYRFDQKYLVRFPGIADFEVPQLADVILCRPVPGAHKSMLQHLYLNLLRPLALSLQGVLVIHASAVSVEGQAIAFVGGSGAGKSTLAVDFALSGYPFLTDDGLVVEEKPGQLLAHPSHPSVRLWRDSDEALLDTHFERQSPLPHLAKARVLADENLPFCAHPRPLSRVYFLGDTPVESITIEPLTEAEAMIEWVRHSFLMDVEERARLSSHFHQVADVARLDIHYRLDYPRTYQDLGTLREQVIAHASA